EPWRARDALADLDDRPARREALSLVPHEARRDIAVRLVAGRVDFEWIDDLVGASDGRRERDCKEDGAVHASTLGGPTPGCNGKVQPEVAVLVVRCGHVRCADQEHGP